jgi:hypothetical protein
MDREPEISGQQAANAQTALRAALGLPPEQFSIQAFVGMISDEIEQLRITGASDEEIATLVTNATGVSVAGSAITRFYASSASRGRESR